MVTETITPTELHPDLTKEQFLEFSEMQSMTEADAREMADWLGVGTEKFNPQTAEFLFFEMGKNQQDSAKGWGRLSVLIAARMIYHQGNPGGKETVDLEDKVRESLSGIQDNVDEILVEGFTSREGTTTWYLTERPKTCLAETVKGVVDWWWQENDPQAQLKRAEFSLANERETLGQTKDLLARQREINQKLQQQLATEGSEVWGDKEREAAAKIYEALPDKVKKKINAVMKKVDLKEPDENLLTKFEEFDGFDLSEVAKWEKAGEILAVLPAIMRLKLEERRKIIAEKRAVKDYFAEHRPTIEVNKKDGIIIDDDWRVNLERAEVLGYEPLNEPDSIVGLKIDTKLEDITGLSIFLKGKAGRINKIFLESQRLNKDSDQYDRESRLNLIALDETRKEFRLVRQFSEGKQTFFVYKAERKIGTLGFSDAGLLINWEEMSLREGLEAVVNVVNLLEETPWGGDKRLKGLVLIAATKGEEKKAEEMPLPPLPQPEEKLAETVIEAAAKSQLGTGNL